MQILRISKENWDEVMAQAVEVLHAGGVVMHPTDTCYGLAADIFNMNALEKLYAIKKMEKSKPVSIMVDSVDRAQEYGDFSNLALKLAREFLPGPLTCIIKRSELLPKYLNEGFLSVGIRCPNNELSLAMLKGFEGPLTTTSANISGSQDVKSVEDYLSQAQGLKLMPDLIIHEEDYLVKNASTIIDFTGTQPSVIRKGELSDNILEYIENIND